MSAARTLPIQPKRISISPAGWKNTRTSTSRAEAVAVIRPSCAVRTTGEV
ncbi:hypothetical protein [Saccharopolyspora sp. NPDC050642]